MDARERDRGVAKETGDTSFSVNEEVVIDRANELIKALNYRNEIIFWLTEPVNRAAIASALSKPKRFVPGFERAQNSRLLPM